jgi:hypothetical protein
VPLPPSSTRRTQQHSAIHITARQRCGRRSLNPPRRPSDQGLCQRANPSPGGFSVGEIWESRGQYETSFNQNVNPNVPAEIQHEVIELHAVAQP